MIPPLHPEEIKAQLRMRYGSVLQFEKAKGLPMRSISWMLGNGGRAVGTAAEAVADELDIPLHRVSSFYHEQYVRLATCPRYRPKVDASHRLNDKAA